MEAYTSSLVPLDLFLHNALESHLNIDYRVLEVIYAFEAYISKVSGLVCLCDDFFSLTFRHV